MKKTFFTKPLFYSLISMALFTGCGEEDLEEEGSEVLSKSDINGFWYGECREVNDIYSKTQYSFDGNYFSYDSTKYSDDACETEIDKIYGQGLFKIVGDVKDSEGTKMAAVDFNFTAFTWTFLDDPSAAVDWSAVCEDAAITGGTINVLDVTCTVGDYTLQFAGEQFGAIHSKGKELYVTDINSNGTTEDERSTTLNLETGALTKSGVSEDDEEDEEDDADEEE
jgi:hypothetical protein